MPQMAPMSWLTLFFYFAFMFLMFNTVNFFLMTYKIKEKETFKKKLTFNWKW